METPKIVKRIERLNNSHAELVLRHNDLILEANEYSWEGARMFNMDDTHIKNAMSKILATAASAELLGMDKSYKGLSPNEWVAKFKDFLELRDDLDTINSLKTEVKKTITYLESTEEYRKWNLLKGERMLDESKW